MMELLNFFAMIGMVINDLLAIFSVIGSVVLFFGSFSDTPLGRYGEIANWSILGLIIDGLFQISMAITGTTPEKIGILVRMTPVMGDGLLVLSFILLIGRWWLKRNRYKFM
jgi:hypothetical protein